MVRRGWCLYASRGVFSIFVPKYTPYPPKHSWKCAYNPGVFMHVWWPAHCQFPSNIRLTFAVTGTGIKCYFACQLKYFVARQKPGISLALLNEKQTARISSGTGNQSPLRCYDMNDNSASVFARLYGLCVNTLGPARSRSGHREQDAFS